MNPSCDQAELNIHTYFTTNMTQHKISLLVFISVSYKQNVSAKNN